MNEYLIRWQPSPLPGRLLAFVYVPETYDETGTYLDSCGCMTFTLEQAQVVHEGWPGSQQGWPEDADA